jgi:hypothetical protein
MIAHLYMPLHFLMPYSVSSQVLTGQRMVANVKFDDRALLSDLQAINQEAANKYLEYAVVRKRSAVSMPLAVSRGNS